MSKINFTMTKKPTKIGCHFVRGCPQATLVECYISKVNNGFGFSWGESYPAYPLKKWIKENPLCEFSVEIFETRRKL
jgi:hypothetical protein